MKRCMNCLSIMDENELVCKNCGCDNTILEPRKTRELIPGTVLKNRFVLGLSVKSNNIFTTYMAYDLDKKREVYVEELLPTRITKRSLGEERVKVNSEYSAKFERAKRLIVHQTKVILESKIKGLDFLGAFVDNNTFYIIRECYKAPTLTQYINFNKNISKEFAKSVVISLIKIMEPLHKLEIICGNIRPSSIIIKDDKTIVITEFGFGALNNVLLLPLYDGFSPLEQYQRNHRLSQKADIYSIAAVYYAIVSGEDPISAKERSRMDILESFSKELKINKSVENALLNAMNLTERGRTSDLREFYDELTSGNAVRNWEKIKNQPKKGIYLAKDFSISKAKNFWCRFVIGVVGVILLVLLLIFVFNTAKEKTKFDINTQDTQVTTTIDN